MAPKKKPGRPKKAAASVTSAPQRAGRSAGRAAPNTITTKRGVEIETTAAARRPTRAVQQTDIGFPSTVPERVPGKKLVPSVVRRRAKPEAKTTVAPAKKAVTSKRGPGRPPKNPEPAAEEEDEEEDEEDEQVEEEAPAPPKKRGRPPGRPSKKVELSAKSTATTKKRGRPKVEKDTADQPPKKRGRPSKADAVPPENEQATPKKRGLPPYGGETTKQDSDDEAAADQLEDELMDEAEGLEEQPKALAKRGRPVKGKGKKAAVSDDAAVADDGIQYWLMKAEQIDRYEELANGEQYNTKFTIDDLKAIGGPEPWDGVRNPTAAKNMRAMKEGDLAFFYASNGKTPGIVGIMEIVKEHEPDVTAHDKSKPGYVKEEKNRDKWCVVHVEFRKKFDQPITRARLQQSQREGPLSNMQEFTAARLSVSKVSADEWDHIMDLAEVTEGDDTAPGADEDSDGAAVTKEEIGTGLIVEQTTATAVNGDVVFEETVVQEESDLPIAPSALATAVMMSTEPELPTTDTIFPLDAAESSIPALPAAASSRPTSRGSRAASVGLAPKTAGSRPGSRAGSRAGSLAPASKRARSKTPQARAGSVQPPSSIAGAAATGMAPIGEE